MSRYALGGSTNAVLHLLALAHEAEVDIVIDDFNRIGEKVPLVGKTLLGSARLLLSEFDCTYRQV